MSQNKHVVIVDDHTMFRRGLAALVNLFPGYEVLFDAGNGKELIAQMDSHPVPDIVLLDISMPEMDGYSTASWLRDHHPGVKVLALSTMDAEVAIIKMIRHGAKGFILKDAEPAELKRAFDEVAAFGYFYNELITRKVISSINNLLDDHSPLSSLVKLSERELDFIRLACSEKSYQQIAREMFVSERTVDGYREALFKKLNVATRVGLVIYAVKNELVKL
ncbi:response regulator transcription factor [Chitinophaga eiseniae]|uniref:Response regulator transcription factor n=1 Tax=Chitinophaga eiseniae TaxID=634771 RepID=A0A847SXU4_9BACT|nr:response regulator transcription factor [Chitinophaga eiseniae]NLR82512.1 response regulator transcription factor [Chitinophaga eiseniae]